MIIQADEVFRESGSSSWGRRRGVCIGAQVRESSNLLGVEGVVENLIAKALREVGHVLIREGSPV